ncbi:MAG: rhodanese-like domain-containing protein [Nitratireductor sp.]|jgi:rhodanese-related sulfurtransferase|nr:rhodanese-like domain-containing protein [Nitratireductor sp.]
MSYAGDMSCRESWEALSGDPKAQLVDVRTAAEWNFVGLPDLSALGREPVLIEWQRYPDMAVNPNFAASLAAELDARGAGRDTPIFFLCRSGARSQSAAAALTAAGYSRAYNIAGGFEGARDANGHRGALEGWKHDGLPWVQR